MTNSIRSLNVSTRLVAAGLIAALALISLPAFASAATYAFVNTSGEVRAVDANTWQAAIATAPGIHTNSGVMLLVNPTGGIVGDNVPVN